ncbi:MAG: hypothetical protein F6K00_29130 [Leptolyngbya sp. SIOISBB]|nr:hypothetical protein [Leptolyngbya sp. SIOISBB]
MTTHQLYLNQEDATQNASGMAVIFFLLGAPNIYSALRQRSQAPATNIKAPVWGIGWGILAFVIAGTWACLTAMGSGGPVS